MIKIADTDGSGVVEFQEFMEMICDQVEVSVEVTCLRLTSFDDRFLMKRLKRHSKCLIETTLAP